MLDPGEIQARQNLINNYNAARAEQAEVDRRIAGSPVGYRAPAPVISRSEQIHPGRPARQIVTGGQPDHTAEAVAAANAQRAAAYRGARREAIRQELAEIEAGLQQIAKSFSIESPDAGETQLYALIARSESGQPILSKISDAAAASTNAAIYAKADDGRAYLIRQARQPNATANGLTIRGAARASAGLPVAEPIPDDGKRTPRQIARASVGLAPGSAPAQSGPQSLRSIARRSVGLI